MSNFLSRLFKKKTGKCGNILIVDDEPGILKVLTLQLESVGYNVTGVEAVESAIAQIENSKVKFRIFIFDMMLVGGNGLKLAKKVRKNKKTAKTPIIIMSGAIAPSKFEKIKAEIPNCEVILKPLKAAELKELIEKCLRGDAIRIDK